MNERTNEPSLSLGVLMLELLLLLEERLSRLESVFLSLPIVVLPLPVLPPPALPLPPVPPLPPEPPRLPWRRMIDAARKTTSSQKKTHTLTHSTELFVVSVSLPRVGGGGSTQPSKSFFRPQRVRPFLFLQHRLEIQKSAKPRQPSLARLANRGDSCLFLSGWVWFGFTRRGKILLNSHLQ